MDYEATKFTICSYNPTLQLISLHLNDETGKPLRNFERLKQHLRQSNLAPLFAVNAGMYDVNGKPIGLYVENGRPVHPINLRKGQDNFYLQPNGMFFVGADGQAKIATTQHFGARESLPVSATQSGPMLLISGKRNPAIQFDGPSKYIRNGVCTLPSGQAAFVIRESEVSFGKLTRLMADILKCDNGLYLDGFVSSLWDPATGRMDNRHDLGPLLVVSRKVIP